VGKALIYKPIYKPKGKAADYGELACNIYSGCPHGCEYCYAPSVLRKDAAVFRKAALPRGDIAASVRAQIEREGITGKTVHLCFTCDPYPVGADCSVTREVIEILKNSGNHVQILTKAGFAPKRDFDLLDGEDKFGVTLTFSDENEKGADGTIQRTNLLRDAHKQGIFTWASFEPVFKPKSVFRAIEYYYFIDLWKFGKMNYRASDIDWKEYGNEVVRLCRQYGRNYLIKGDLREIMEA
jgi:DNA repair photolyase